MIETTRMPLKTAKVFTVSSAIKGDNISLEKITCLGERQ